jgi:hypothetical protein
MEVSATEIAEALQNAVNIIAVQRETIANLQEQFKEKRGCFEYLPDTGRCLCTVEGQRCVLGIGHPGKHQEYRPNVGVKVA